MVNNQNDDGTHDVEQGHYRHKPGGDSANPFDSADDDQSYHRCRKQAGKYLWNSEGAVHSVSDGIGLNSITGEKGADHGKSGKTDREPLPFFYPVHAQYNTSARLKQNRLDWSACKWYPVYIRHT